MSKPLKTFSLSADERAALEAICRRRKVDALVWKRARAFLLLDTGEDAGTVCRILDIGPSVLSEWRFAFAASKLSFFTLKDYSPRQGHLSAQQEQALKAHFAEHPARNADEVCAYILTQYAQSYSPSGAARLMARLGFEYKNQNGCPPKRMKPSRPRLLPAPSP